MGLGPWLDFKKGKGHGVLVFSWTADELDEQKYSQDLWSLKIFRVLAAESSGVK